MELTLTVSMAVIGFVVLALTALGIMSYLERSCQRGTIVSLQRVESQTMLGDGLSEEQVAYHVTIARINRKGTIWGETSYQISEATFATLSVGQQWGISSSAKAVIPQTFPDP